MIQINKLFYEYSEFSKSTRLTLVPIKIEKKWKIPIEITSFKTLIDKFNIIFDKTEFIAEIIEDTA